MMRLPPTPRAGAEPSWDVVSASQDRKRPCLGPGLPPDVLNGGLGHLPPPLGLECHTPGLGSRSAPHLADEERRVPLEDTGQLSPRGRISLWLGVGQGWSHTSWASELVWGQTEGPAYPGGQRERSQTAKANTNVVGIEWVGGDEGIIKVST